MTHRMQLPSHILHCIQQESSLLALRQGAHSKHPQLILEQLLNLKHTTHPITLRMEGASSTSSWLSIFTPSPQTGALDSMSTMLHALLLSQLEHSIRPMFITPLQEVIFSCFLQLLHLSLRLTLMGESATWMSLFGATSSMLSAGLPSETVRVVNKYWGGHLSYDCPSGLVTLMQSIVLRTKAILSMRVQYSSGLGLFDEFQFGPFMMMLS